MKEKNKHHGNRGFTLVELMIALTVSGIVASAVYAAFKSQHNTYLAQDQVAEMQQNIRAGLGLMVREIRMAGYDPTKTADAGITAATVNQISFTKDDSDGTAGSDGDGDITDSNEVISFGFAAADDADNDGIVDDLDGDGTQNDVASLGRDTGGGFQPVAENIQAIEFYYTLADGTQTKTPAATAYDDLLSVQISILARAGDRDRSVTNNKVYCPASNPFDSATQLCASAVDTTWGPYNDDYRRRILTTTVTFRNLGL